MEKNKTGRGYKFLCLGLVGIICIMLTGAGSEKEEECITAASNMLVSEASEIYVIQDERITLNDLVSDDCILRITYDLSNKSKRDIGIIKGFNGNKELLGCKIDQEIKCISEKPELENLFPILKFEGYSWIDAEKSIGIISLCLNNESKRQIEQMIDTVIYEQLSKDNIKSLNEATYDSVQKIEISSIYNFEIPKQFLDNKFSANDTLKITRDIDVIIPENIN